MSYISKWRLQDNSVVPIGSNLFGTCSSGASDTTKVVSLSAFDVLVEGVTIHVYFANANSGSNTLLQVGSTSAQPIKRNGVAEGKWEAGSVISFTYSQGYWVQNDADEGGGGGGGETYTLSKNGDIITLTGSGGDTSFVTDDNTTYTFALYGGNLVISGSDGSQQVVPIPDNDTTYELESNLETITHMLYVNLDGGGYEYYEDNFVVNNNGVEYLAGDHQVYIVDSDGNDITGISTYNLMWTGTQTDAYTFGQNLYDYFATHNAYRLKIDGVLTQKITKYGTYYDLTEAIPDYDRVTAKEWVHQGTGGDVFFVTAQGVVLGNKSTIDLVGSDGTISSVNLKAIDIGALPTAQYHVNDATHSGYVKSPSGLPGIRVWKTDATGEPGWRLEIGDTTYTISISGDTITLTDSNGNTQTATISDFTGATTSADGTNGFVPAPTSKSSAEILAHTLLSSDGLWSLVKLSKSFVGQNVYVNIQTSSSNGTYSDSGVKIDVVDASHNGLMSVSDKAKLDGIAPSSTTPLMDGTASVGSEANYARGDHRHPSDTSKQDTLVSGTNIKTINGNSILGSGNLTTPDEDTTYTFSISGNTLTITDSDGNTQTITLPSGAVSGVKGNAESTYRTGNVNLTAANVGALPISGGTMTSNGQIINGHITNSSSRETTPNLTPTGKRGITALLASSLMTTARPGEGTIIHCEWDTNAGWNAQLFIADNDTGNGKPFVAVRGQRSGTWTAWDRLLAQSDVTDYVIAQSQSTTSYGNGYWRWREWNSGKVEIWYHGSLTLTTSDSDSNGVKRYSRWFNLPNSYSLYRCTCIVNGMDQGAWYGCGGVRDSGGTVNAEPTRAFQVMGYRIQAQPPTTPSNLNIYICGQKTI